MATADEVPTLLLLSGEGATLQESAYTLSAAEADAISTAVSMAELKPIIMSVNANEPSSTAETQVEEVSETVLASHLMAEKPAHRQSRGQQTREVYEDSDSGVTYEIVKGGTRRGGDKLIDSLGFTYNLKGKGTKNVTYWWCSVRNNRLRCPAAVIQRNGIFMRGKRKHEHLFGQSTPKNETTYIRRHPPKSPAKMEQNVYHGYSNKVSKMKGTDGMDYHLIYGGSKAGMDLLKDGLGYTYTLKKTSADGFKKHWRCSVRNKHLRCFATVIQLGNKFSVGPSDHSHLPGRNKPMGPADTLPTLKGLKSPDTSTYADDDEGASGSNYVSYSYASAKHKHRMVRERKKKEHPTFLGPSCTINLTKCDDIECNCRLVHCPFCDVHHFKPAKAGRVQDHLEMTHFAHGVQYDDLMIVKCFQDCNLERDFGHYHCVFCFQQILKRNAYARHLLRHMRRMGIPDRLLVLPDSKFPDVINAYGFEIPICKKICDHVLRDKHYHCPQCDVLCKERSLTVNHLWRCLQRARDDPSDPVSDDPDEEMTSVIDDSLLLLHFSHVKSLRDIPVERCDKPGCCDGKYHCVCCPTSVFMPTYKQHLIAHLVAHWKQRVIYKGFGILKCFHFCDGIDRSQCKTRYHFHCPIDGKIILTKASFEDHLRTCHMFRFGENLITIDPEDADDSIVNELNASQDLVPLTEDIEFMEDRLTAQAVAYDAKKQLERQLQKSNRAFTRGYRGRNQVVTQIMNSTIADIKKEISGGLDDDDDDDVDDEDYDDMEDWKATGDSGIERKGQQNKTKANNDEEDTLLDIKESEIFDLCSAIVSNKVVKALKTPAAVKSVLGKISGLTNTKVTMVKNDSQYLMSGKLEGLLEAKRFLLKAFEKDTRKVKSTAGTYIQTPRAKMLKGKGAPKTCPEPKQETAKVKLSSIRGRSSRKSDGTDDNSFPYSEINKIIAATQENSPAKRGRGRPPKKSPALAVKDTPVAKKTTKKTVETPASSTPQGRYSTRGIRKNYVEMNSGVVSIKQEPVSEDEPEPEEESEQSDEEDNTRRTTRSSAQNTPKRKHVSPITKRSSKRQKKVEDIEEEEAEADNEEEEVEHEVVEIEFVGEEEGEFNVDQKDESEIYLDDSEQEMEELDEDNSRFENSIDLSDQKITDSTVNSLKTTNVSTSVPSVFKVGMRVKMPKKRNKQSAGALDDSDDDMRDEDKPVSVNLKCSLCEDFTAETFSDLTKHLITFHHVYDPPRCDVCQKDFENSHTLKLHLDRRHGPKSEPRLWKCVEEGCNKEFTSQNGLTGHTNRVHMAVSTPQKRHSCNKCSFECNSEEGIHHHKRVKHGDPITCRHCSKNFMNFQSLKSHIYLKHSSAEPVTCEICNKTLSHPRYLQKHKESHFPPKYSCYICQKKVQSNASLKAHLETHKPESERTYRHICSYCGKPFALKSNYDDHLNKHTGARPYKCDICQRAFSFRSMLAKHKTFVHSSERPYKCGNCMKGFKFMNLLQNHMITHTNKSKHVCPTCSNCFTTASTLKFHQQKCKGMRPYWNKSQTPSQSMSMILYTDTGPVKVMGDIETSVASNVLQDHASMVAPDSVTVETTPLSDVNTINKPMEVDMLKSIEAGTATEETVVMDPAQGVSGTLEIPGVSSEEVLETTQATTGGEVEVYACSECNLTYATYKEAEHHILTSHTATQVQMESETVHLSM